MNDTFAMAAAGMAVVERMLDNAARNASNSRTPGYLARKTVTRSFQTELDRQLNRAPSLLRATEHTSFQQGSLVPSEGQLDVALMGPGFLAIQGPEGPLFTRNGSLALGKDGLLTTQAGYPVLGQGGPIRADLVSAAAVRIGEDGAVYQGDQQVGRLRIVEFEDRDRLKRVGETVFSAPPEAGMKPAEDTTVVSGHLELPPEKSIIAMVQMIQASRSFEAQQRMIRAMDRTYEGLIRQIN